MKWMHFNNSRARDIEARFITALAEGTSVDVRKQGAREVLECEGCSRSAKDAAAEFLMELATVCEIQECIELLVVALKHTDGMVRQAVARTLQKRVLDSPDFWGMHGMINQDSRYVMANVSQLVAKALELPHQSDVEYVRASADLCIPD